MTDDPFLTLVVEALNLMHPRFAAAHGRAYSPTEADEPPAARKARERSFLMEFYHEFRRLWDQALPVKLGLGHILIQADPEAGTRTPDLLFWQLGEHGQPDRRIGAVSLALHTNPAAVAADQTLLARFRTNQGYRYTVSVVLGRRTELVASATDACPAGVTVILFDLDAWQATVAP